MWTPGGMCGGKPPKVHDITHREPTVCCSKETQCVESAITVTWARQKNPMSCEGPPSDKDGHNVGKPKHLPPAAPAPREVSQ